MYHNLCLLANLTIRFFHEIQEFILFSSIIKKMTSHNAEKPGLLKSLCVIQQAMEPQYLPCYENEADVVTYQTHSMKTDLRKEDESNLFSKVLSFITQFLQDPKLQTEIKKHMSKYHKSGSRISSEEKNEKQLSFKKMTFDSKICFDAEVVREQETEGRAVRGNNKRISIFVMEEEYSSERDLESDEIMSKESVRTIRSIEISHMEMNASTIAAIFDTPQPFLMNLSLCLFIRYCLSTRRKVRLQDSSWVLCVATVLAYKLYYDEVVQGLLECFVNIMKISKQDLVDLQRCFLEEIDYNTVIRNHDYYFILTRFIGAPLCYQLQ